METKKCSSCQAEIPIKAKKCSQCQTDLRSWVSKHPILSGLGVFIIILFVIGNMGNKQIQNSSGASQNNQPALEVLSVDTKVTEQNSVWWKYSWVFTVKNHTDRDRVINAELNWKDKDSFTVETAREYGLSVPANSEQTFSGYELITVQVAPTIDGIEVQIK